MFSREPELFFSGSPRDLLENILLKTELTDCLFLEFLSNWPQKSVDLICSDSLEAYDDSDLIEAYVPVEEAPDDVDESVEEE